MDVQFSGEKDMENEILDNLETLFLKFCIIRFWK